MNEPGHLCSTAESIYNYVFYFIIKLQLLCNLDIALGHIVILIMFRLTEQPSIKRENNKPCLNCDLNSE